jgi:(p)ppGpp synthase/HD superfamily hydrolase
MWMNSRLPTLFRNLDRSADANANRRHGRRRIDRFVSKLRRDPRYEKETSMTPRYTKALTLAARAHEGQVRKGTTIPYITHPVAVAGLVAQYNGDEDQQIAALLHDVLEDAGPQFAAAIEAEFGERVLRIVEGCTDGVPDATGKKGPWAQRKESYLAHLVLAPDETLLVSACDKLNNARAILDDLHEVGGAAFERFTAKKEGTLWYYAELARVFDTRGSIVAPMLSLTVAEIARLAHEAD